MKFQHLYREIHFFMNNLAENSNFQHFLTEKGRFQVLFEPFWTETDHDILVTIFDIFIFKKYGTNSKFYRTVPPLPLFYQVPLKELGLSVEQAVMIGDDARDDVNGAVAAGLKGILVKTGKFADGDEKDCDDILYCADDLSDAVDFLIKKGLV